MVSTQTVDNPEPLTTEQLEKLDEMRNAMQDETVPEGSFFKLDDLCYLRYLRARDWNVSKAAKSLKHTLSWRQEFGADKLHTAEYMDLIKEENATMKLYTRGHDREGRPVMYMRPSAENTFNHGGNMKHVVYNMERAIRAMGDGIEKLVMICDYSGYSLRTAPSIRSSKEFLDILANHYVERLSVCFLVDSPWIFGATFKAISPFIDPVSKAKIVFLRPSDPDMMQMLEKRFDLEQVEEFVGGRLGKYESSDFLAMDMDVASK